MSYYTDFYLRIHNNKELPITILESIAEAIEDYINKIEEK